MDDLLEELLLLLDLLRDEGEVLESELQQHSELELLLLFSFDLFLLFLLHEPVLVLDLLPDVLLVSGTVFAQGWSRVELKLFAPAHVFNVEHSQARIFNLIFQTTQVAVQSCSRAITRRLILLLWHSGKLRATSMPVAAADENRQFCRSTEALSLQLVSKLVFDLVTIKRLISLARHANEDLDPNCLVWQDLSNHDLLRQVERVVPPRVDEVRVSWPSDVAIVHEDVFLLERLAWHGLVVVWQAQ